MKISPGQWISSMPGAFRRLEEQEKLLKEKNENLNALMENVPAESYAVNIMKN